MAKHNLANALRLAGRAGEALPLFESLTASRDERYHSLGLLGAALSHSDMGDPTRALAFAEKALQRPDATVLHRHARAVILVRRGDFARAELEMRQIVNERPDLLLAREHLVQLVEGRVKWERLFPVRAGEPASAKAARARFLAEWDAHPAAARVWAEVLRAEDATDNERAEAGECLDASSVDTCGRSRQAPGGSLDVGGG
jgi:tetratricopeptide (TPR) repeat protein